MLQKILRFSLTLSIKGGSGRLGKSRTHVVLWFVLPSKGRDKMDAHALLRLSRNIEEGCDTSFEDDSFFRPRVTYQVVLGVFHSLHLINESRNDLLHVLPSSRDTPPRTTRLDVVKAGCCWCLCYYRGGRTHYSIVLVRRFSL